MRHRGIHVARRYVQLDYMAVTPPAQRQGVGRALIDAAADWAKRRDIADLELNVFQFNKSAIGLYEATGFVTQCRQMIRKI